MITPNRLNEIMGASEEALASFNSSLCDKIAARVQATFNRDGESHLNPSSISDIRKMMNTGLVAEDIQKEITRRLPHLEKEVQRAFLNASAEIAKDINGFTVKLGNSVGANVPNLPSKSPNGFGGLNITSHEKSLLESNYRRTNGTVRNLTRTTVSAGQEAYIKACDEAMMQVQRGVSLDKAITDAIKKMAQAGITTVDYKSGRRDRVEVALARAIRTGINLSNADLTLQRCAELGVNLVRVSQHLGARVTDRLDYTNHAHWQGKVYSLDWSKGEFAQYSPLLNISDREQWNFIEDIKAELVNKDEYPDFVEECGFGNILGICGINCRHTFTAFWDGISTNTDEPLDEDENERRYKETQTQRAYERNIRALKREISALEHLPIQTEESASELGKLKKDLAFIRKKYAEYVKEHNLPKAGWRVLTANEDRWHHNVKYDEFKDSEAYRMENFPFEKAETLKRSNNKRIENADYYIYNGTKYKVGDNGVILDVSESEKNVAEILVNKFGGLLKFIPKISGNNRHIPTPDYLWDNQRWDLKELTTWGGKDPIRNAVKGKREQADHFIIRITKDYIPVSEVSEKIEEIFFTYNTVFVKQIILMRFDEVIAVYTKTKKGKP